MGDINTKKIIFLFLFSLSMAYLESTIVVYLRLIYFPDGFNLQISHIPQSIMIVEIGREAATMVMLATIALLSVNTHKLRFASFILCFGIWDLFYYIWLKVLINWPQTWLDWDLLFLIPTVWVAPWLAPAIICISMILGSLLVLYKPDRFSKYIFDWKEWMVIIIAMLIILSTFFFETQNILQNQLPVSYPWWLFCSGVMIAWTVIFRRYFYFTTMGTKNTNRSQVLKP